MNSKSSEKPDKVNKIKNKNKNKVLIISTSVLVFLLFMAGIIYIFHETILMAIAPKEYAAYCLSQTATQLKDDTGEVLDTLLGFEMKADTDVTFTNQVDLADADTPYESIEVAYVPSQNGASAQIKGVSLYDQDVDMDILWNDKIIGIGVNELSEEQYYAVSSKKFGKQLSDTKLPISKDIKENKQLADMDLSFSNIMGSADSEEDAFEELKDAVTDETLNFLDKGTVQQRNVQKRKINGKEESVYTLSLNFEGEAIKDYLLNCIDIASKDSDFKERFGDNAMSGWEEDLKQGNYDYVASIDIVMYDDRVIGFSCKADEVLVSFNFDSTECLLDGFDVSYTSPNKAFELTTKGNIKPTDGKTKYIITINSDGAYTYMDINMDFDKGKAKLVTEFPSVDKMTFEGTCKMGDGFKLDVEGKDSAIKLSLVSGGDLCELSGEEYMLLEESTSSLLWNFGKMIFQSEEARGIIVGFAKEAFEDSDIIDSLLNSDGGIVDLLGF